MSDKLTLAREIIDTMMLHMDDEEMSFEALCEAQELEPSDELREVYDEVIYDLSKVFQKWSYEYESLKG